MDEVKRKKKLWAILCMVGLVLALGTNTLAINLPLGGNNTAQVSNDYPSLIVPANFAFAIWGPIYLGLMALSLIFLIGAFSPLDKLNFLPDIGPYYLASSILNSLWIVSWHYRLFPLSVALIFGLLASLALIFIQFDPHLKGKPPGTLLFFRLPFGLYFGWVSVAAMANVATMMIAEDWAPYAGDPALWTMSLLVVGTVLGLWMVLGRDSIGYGAAIAWAIWGIYVKRSNNPQDGTLGIQWLALLASLLLIIVVLTKAILLLGKGLPGVRSQQDSPFSGS
jgi:hypothetical protein